jgi:hypothetical protein
MLALEAIKARHGDCLILHWGLAHAPELVLVDGGPDRVYRDFLRPRLEELRQKFASDGALRLSLAMLSHIDDDHIQGLLELTTELVEWEGKKPEFRIERLWHNSFEDVVGHGESTSPTVGSAVAELQSVAGALDLPSDQATAAVLTSIPQGIDLRTHARKLNLMAPMNEPFGGIVAAGARDVPVTLRPAVSDAEPLRLRVIAPSEKRIAVLRRKWIEWLRRHPRNLKEALTTAYKDQSVYNLSSIVVLVTYEKKSILLTGDARGDDILQGLEMEGMMRERRFHVDVLKLPHHGSNNNVRPDFFEQVTADHYVASGDQIAFPNPRRETFEWIREARRKVMPDRRYDVWLTYDLPDITRLFSPDECHIPGREERSIMIALND